MANVNVVRLYTASEHLQLYGGDGAVVHVSGQDPVDAPQLLDHVPTTAQDPE